jgi:hypothetical protein
LLLVALSAGNCLQAAPLDPALAAFLDRSAADYSPQAQMLGCRFASPGYHTTVASGAWVHRTLDSLDYADALLARGEPGDVARARQIIAKVISLQDARPQSPTCGIWPWLLEEPLAKMSPPDFNWADFCGGRLAQMLVDHRPLLGDELQKSMLESLRLAGQAIVRRNVGPDYTNIAVAGGGVCAAAGELLHDPALLEYGRSRLEKLVAYTAAQGSFNEYNSPAYTMTALWECERTLHLVQDPAARQAAESLRRTAWQIIAESFHPGTQQWAGPHSRVYHDYLLPKVAEYLSRETGVAVQPHPSAGGATRHVAVTLPNALPCPAELCQRFRALPQTPLELQRTFIRGRSDLVSTVGTTWLDSEVCLGSVNRSTFWTQRRPLIGYWKTDADPAVVFRLRFLHDDRDFASMGGMTAQRGPRALTVFTVWPNQGDWHPQLDRPKDGLFTAADFRIRYELFGRGVTADPLGEGRCALRAGRYRAVIHTIPSLFDGCKVVWQISHSENRVFLDGICYHGTKRSFDLRTLGEVTIAVGVEILRTDEPPAKHWPQLTAVRPGLVEATWDVGEKLHVHAP